MPRRRVDERRRARSFGLALLPILLVAGGLSWWRGHARAAAALAALSVLPPVLALAAPRLWAMAFRAWMRLAEGMSRIVTAAVLSIFYFGMMTPIGLAMRPFRKDPLDLSWKRRRPSYWIEKKPSDDTLERYERQF